MKAVIYSRISKDEQSKYSISEQVQLCQKMMENEGHEVVDVFVDEGYTSKNMNRPALQSMLSQIKSKRFGIICVWNSDRLTRTTLDGLEMVTKMFKPSGIEFASVTEDIDTSTPDGMMMFTIRLSMAQREREKIAERVAMGQIGRAKKGKRNTSAKPYGYEVGEDLVLSVNEEEAEIVRNIYTWYVQGFGRNKIASILNDSNIPAPRGGIWFEKIIGDIIGNPTHIGSTHYKPKLSKEEDRIIVPDTHPAIIPRDLFDIAKEIKVRRRDNDMNLSSYDFCFSTVVKCGECGRSFHGKMKTNAPGRARTRNYRCSGKYRQNSCNVSDVSDIKLEKIFLDFIKGRLEVESEEPNKPIGGKDVTKEKKRLEKIIADSAVRRKNYSRAMGDGKMSYDDFSDLMEEENAKVKKLQEELEAIQLSQGPKRTNRESNQLLTELLHNWPLMSEQQKKIGVGLLFRAIVLKKIDGIWKIVAFKDHE